VGLESGSHSRALAARGQETLLQGLTGHSRSPGTSSRTHLRYLSNPVAVPHAKASRKAGKLSQLNGGWSIARRPHQAPHPIDVHRTRSPSSAGSGARRAAGEREGAGAMAGS
jgi:hypothetical protein